MISMSYDHITKYTETEIRVNKSGNGLSFEHTKDISPATGINWEKGIVPTFRDLL